MSAEPVSKPEDYRDADAVKQPDNGATCVYPIRGNLTTYLGDRYQGSWAPSGDQKEDFELLTYILGRFGDRKDFVIRGPIGHAPREDQSF